MISTALMNEVETNPNIKTPKQQKTQELKKLSTNNFNTIFLHYITSKIALLNFKSSTAFKNKFK